MSCLGPSNYSGDRNIFISDLRLGIVVNCMPVQTSIGASSCRSALSSPNANLTYSNSSRLEGEDILGKHEENLNKVVSL
jgi:hypothetical protein